MALPQVASVIYGQHYTLMHLQSPLQSVDFRHGIPIAIIMEHFSASEENPIEAIE